MTLIEFIKHPAYNYYITTLVHEQLLQYDNYKDIYYIRNNNKFNFYLKTYSND